MTPTFAFLEALGQSCGKAYKVSSPDVLSAMHVSDLVALFSQPQTLAVVLVQFFLGLGLGYVSVKALKYVLAFIAILVLGTFLSVWSLGATPSAVLQSLGAAVALVKDFAIALGLMTIGPVSVGFVVGAIVGLMKK